MSEKFLPERLIKVREALGISKAEASRLLNLSKMGYGRYENGQRIPSPQTIEYMAQRMGTTYEYLTGTTDDPNPDYLIIDQNLEPELYSFICSVRGSDPDLLERLEFYFRSINDLKGD